MTEHLCHDLPFRTCTVCAFPIRPADLVTVGEFVARHSACELPGAAAAVIEIGSRLRPARAGAPAAEVKGRAA